MSYREFNINDASVLDKLKAYGIKEDDIFAALECDLSDTQMYAKSIKGTPLKIPDLRGPQIFLALSNDRHALIEMANHLPRCHYSFIIAAWCLCFGVPGASLICIEVCFLFGQRKLLSSLVTDGLRVDRRCVVRWINRRSSCRFGIGNSR